MTVAFFAPCRIILTYLLRACLTGWTTDVCRFASEVSSVAAAHADADVVAVTGGDDQGMTGAAVVPAQASEDAVVSHVTTGDVVMDERPVDEEKESVDSLATRNQC